MNTDKFNKIAIYNNGSICFPFAPEGIYSHKKSHMKGVYMILFENGDSYIGSSLNIYRRILGHTHVLKANKCTNKVLQASFNAHNRFEVYCLMEMDDNTPTHMPRIMESLFINLLEPTINRMDSSNGHINFNEYIFNIQDKQ